jgi:Predicted phosphohydrolases
MLNDYVPSFYKVTPKAIIGGSKFLMLNSVIPDDEDPNTNKSRGLLSKETLKYVEDEIKDGIPTIIAFHHPPLEPGGWLNRKLLDNRDEFNNLIHDTDNVKLVLYGHIHYPTLNEINGTMYVSAPSVGFAFDKDLPKFQIAQGEEGINIIDITSNSATIEKVLISTGLSQSRKYRNYSAILAK